MHIDWAETPGGYYAIAYILSCYMMIINSPKRIEKKYRICTVTGLGIFLFIWMTLTKGVEQWLFIPTMIVVICIVWIIMYRCCQYDLKTSFYFTIRVFIIGEFIASLEFQIFYYLIAYQIFPLNHIVNVMVLVIVDGALITVLYKLEKRNREVNENIRVNRQELISVIIIAIAIYTVSNLSYLMEGINMEDIVIEQLYLLRTLMDMGGVAILFAYHTQLSELKMRFEVQRLQDMLEMQQNNYEMLRQSVSVVDQKYHDLKYQISVLKTEAGSGKSMAYLEQMEQDIKAYEAQNKTGNKILDTILTGKSLYCQNNWIELTSVADGHALDFMDSMDISILFGNMLDNAIESVMKIEQKEKRLIHLAVARQKGFLRIRVENCYGEKPNFENGILKTSKSDKQYHGFGMKSIQNIVKKYGGSTTIQVENGWFELRILIPLKNNINENQSVK